jgi:hypothetical protein
LILDLSSGDFIVVIDCYSISRRKITGGFGALLQFWLLLNVWPSDFYRAQEESKVVEMRKIPKAREIGTKTSDRRK